MSGTSTYQFARKAVMSAWALMPSALTARIIVYRLAASFPDALRAQLEWIKAQGFRGTTVKETVLKIRRRSIRDARIIAIAIDVEDIRRVDTMAQQIADLGFAATFFIDAAALGVSAQSHALLRSLARGGMEIGSRGSPWTCPVRRRDGSTETFLRALVGGKHLLEDVIGRRVDSYAYPNAGRRCIRSARPWVMQLGFESAATSDWNRLSDDTDLYSLPRCEIAAADSPADFIDKLTGKRDYLRYLPS